MDRSCCLVYALTPLALLILASTIPLAIFLKDQEFGTDNGLQTYNGIILGNPYRGQKKTSLNLLDFFNPLGPVSGSNSSNDGKSTLGTTSSQPPDFTTTTTPSTTSSVPLSTTSTAGFVWDTSPFPTITSREPTTTTLAPPTHVTQFLLIGGRIPQERSSSKERSSQNYGSGEASYKVTSTTEIADIYVDRDCSNPRPFPKQIQRAKGILLNGRPIVCGGLTSQESDVCIASEITTFEYIPHIPATEKAICHQWMTCFEYNMTALEWQLFSDFRDYLNETTVIGQWSLGNLQWDMMHMFEMPGAGDSFLLLADEATTGRGSATSLKAFNISKGSYEPIELEQDSGEHVIRSLSCLVRLTESTVMITGGKKVSTAIFSGATPLRVNYLNLLTGRVSTGPRIRRQRISHACGVMNEDNGDRVVIIAGGESHWEQFSSETFTLKSGRSQFSEGPDLNRKAYAGVMVNDAFNKGVVLIGGRSHYDNVYYSLDRIFHLACKDCEWVQLKLRLNVARFASLAIPLPANNTILNHYCK